MASVASSQDPPSHTASLYFHCRMKSLWSCLQTQFFTLWAFFRRKMHGLHWELDFLLQRQLESCMGTKKLKHWNLNSLIIKKKKKNQLKIICQLSLAPPKLCCSGWGSLCGCSFPRPWAILTSSQLPFPWAPPQVHASHPTCGAGTSPSVPLNFIVEGKLGYRKVVFCLSAQRVSFSETYKLAPVDRHQCRASLRHITSWHDNWGGFPNRMGHFPVPPFKKYLPQCLCWK